MKLGSAINSIEFSDSERERLGHALLKEGTLPFNILHSKFRSINDNDFWRRAQKHLGITGFRNGHPMAQNMVLERALNNLRKGAVAGFSDIWPLYRRCAINYIVHDLAKLNNLLLAEELTEGEGSYTEQIFRCIQPRLFFYGSSIEDVRQLYELWGFERVESFEKLFIEVGISGDLVRRLIFSENEKLKNEMRNEVSSLKSDISRLSNANSQQSIALAGRLDEFGVKLDHSMSEVHLKIAAIGNSIAEIDSNKQRPASKKESCDDVGAPNATTAELGVLQTKLELIAASVREQSEDLLKLKEHQTENKSHYESAGVAAYTKDLFPRWMNAYVAAGAVNIDDKLLWSILELIRRSRIIITSKPEFILSIFKELPSSEIKNIAASPLWTEAAEWTDAQDFVSGSSSNPRVLIISDFDVAIQETYLVPGLIAFLRSTLNPCSRIILVPSKANTESICDRLWEFCCRFDVDDLWFAEAALAIRSVKDKAKENLSSNAVEFLRYVESTNLNFERDLKRLASNTGISLPMALIEQFTNLYAGLADISTHEYAWQLSTQVALLPWVQSVRGENFRRIFEETLSTNLFASHD